MKRIPLALTLAALVLLIGTMIWLNWMTPDSAESMNPTQPYELPSTGTAQEIVHPPRGFLPRWDTLRAYDRTMRAVELTALLEDVYAVGDAWKKVIQIKGQTAVIQTGGDPFVLKLLPENAPPPESVKRYWKTGSLENLHIAIDAGHIGGKFAEVERRQFGFPEDNPVREGEITLLTARRLQPLLEAMGARVSLVRKSNRPVTKLRSKDFLMLYKEYNPSVPNGLLMPYAQNRFYRRAEIVARAKVVNKRLRPDLLLCLHYNASSGSGAWASPTRPILVDENHFHLLLNGAYTSGEVLDEGDRFQMIERILQRIHPRELELARVVADVFAEKTGLPPYTYEPNSMRAKNIDGHPYLWARNLLANRSYTCPVLFFEPWVMNNREVYARIQAGDYEGTKEINGKEQPSIMREYAEAVAAGIARFFGTERAP